MKSIEFNKKQNCMDINEFCIHIKKGIQHRLGMRFHVEVQELVKNNGVKLYELIITKQGCNSSPSVCLNCCYRQYQRNKSIDEIEKNIIDIAGNNLVKIF